MKLYNDFMREYHTLRFIFIDISIFPGLEHTSSSCYFTLFQLNSPFQKIFPLRMTLSRPHTYERVLNPRHTSSFRNGVSPSSFFPVLEFLTDPGDASRTISRLSREGVWRIRGKNIQEVGYKFVPSPRGNPSIVI